MLLTLEQELDLSQRQRRGDEQARAQLIASNQGLVYQICRSFSHRHALDDLVQEGNMGLLRAIEMFDPTRRLRFGTYAAWWIRAFVLRFMKNQNQVHTQRAQLVELSLESPSTDDELALIDRLEAPGRLPDEVAQEGQLAAQVGSQIERLRKRLTGLPWDIVHERLMCDPGEATILAELGQRYGVSRERVRQVEMKTRAFLARQLTPLQEAFE